MLEPQEQIITYSSEGKIKQTEQSKKSAFQILLSLRNEKKENYCLLINLHLFKITISHEGNTNTERQENILNY